MNQPSAIERAVPSVLFPAVNMARRVILAVGLNVAPTIARKLMSAGYALARTNTALEAQAFVSERLPVAVLLRLAPQDELRLIRWIREQERLAFVQVFLSTTYASIASAVRAGADDVFDVVDDDAADRMVARIRRAQALAQLALLDPLTQLHNRRFMNDRLQAEVARAVRAQTTFSVALVDLDDFKYINDTFGHAAGDRVLAAFADALRRDLRAYDVPCRFGGDEFVVLFPDSDAAGAQAALAKLRARAGWSVPGLPLGTFSAGIAQFPDDGHTWSRLFDVADRRARAAKNIGGDQTSIT